MEFLKLSPELQEEVRRHIKKTNYPREQQTELQKFTELLRQGLNHKVNFKTNQKIILYEYCIQRTRLAMINEERTKSRATEQESARSERSVSSLSSLISLKPKNDNLSIAFAKGEAEFTRLVNFISRSLKIEYFDPEKPILKQGDENSRIYYMLAGLAEVKGWSFKSQAGDNLKGSVSRDTASHSKIRDLDKGQYFGEISYLLNTVASATVSATNYTSLGFLEKDKVDEMFNMFPVYKA